MNAYLPQSLADFWQIIAVLLVTLFVGFGITRITNVRFGRWAAWLLLVAATVVVERLSSEEPAGFRMVALILVLLWSMKTVVSVEAQADGQPHLGALPWLAFAVGWLGMRPAIFARLRRSPLPGAGKLLAAGAVNVLGGICLMVLARWAVEGGTIHDQIPARFLATVPFLVGLSFILHFGLINLSAGFWRLWGVDARPLFKAPLASRSLTEFWGKRWNLAFVEMTAIAIYRPLRSRLGRPLAMFAAFLFSGLLHEMAISVPVKAGFGLPSLYFALHGLLVLVEGRLERSGFSIKRLGWWSRVWTLGWLAIPLPLLFHWPFLRGVVWPLAGFPVNPE
ncbi:MAG: wax synthase family protein [Gemmataceae bacterium]